MNTHKGCVVHHTVTDQNQNIDDAIASINASHKQRGFPQSQTGYYVGYHYIIAADGTVKQTRKDDEIGAHCVENNKNFDSLGIALLGNFEVDTLTKRQYEALVNLLRKKVEEYGWEIPDITYHAMHKATACCGKNVKNMFATIREDVYSKKPVPNVPQWGYDAAKYFEERGIVKNFDKLGKPIPMYHILEIMRKNNEWLINEFKK